MVSLLSTVLRGLTGRGCTLPQRHQPPPHAHQELGVSGLVAVVQLVRVLPQVVELSFAVSVLGIELLLRPYGLESGAAPVFAGRVTPAIRKLVAAQQRDQGAAKFRGRLHEEGGAPVSYRRR